MTTAFDAMADAYSASSAAMYPHTVTFRKPTVIKSATAGQRLGTPITKTPTNIPCRYGTVPSRAGIERMVGGKVIEGAMYYLYLPAKFSNLLVDVDNTCNAEMYDDSGLLLMTLQVREVGRNQGIELKILASTED